MCCLYGGVSLGHCLHGCLVTDTGGIFRRVRPNQAGSGDGWRKLRLTTPILLGIHAVRGAWYPLSLTRLDGVPAVGPTHPRLQNKEQYIRNRIVEGSL